VVALKTTSVPGRKRSLGSRKATARVWKPSVLTRKRSWDTDTRYFNFSIV